MVTWVKKQTALNLLPAVFALFVLAPILWLLFDRGDVVTLTNLRIVPNPAKAGEHIEIQWDVDLHRKGCSGEIKQGIIAANNQIYTFESEASVYHEAGKYSYVKDMILPGGMVKGPAIYRSSIVRWCNPLQQFFWPMAEEIHEARFAIIQN